MRRRTRHTLVTRRLTLALGCALGVALAACSGGSGDATAPDPNPPTNDPGPTPNPQGGVQGHYTLEQINDSKPGQLVTISNPDGKVIGLYRFDAATTLDMDALQTFTMQLRFSDDKEEYGLPDEGEFKGAGPAADGALPLTFSSTVYDDSFTGVVVGDIVAIKYDLDGDGQADTSFGFRRAD
ncbi:MAG: hypothetical protein ACJ8DC_01780 [Gemmatimonadales bacterium]